MSEDDPLSVQMNFYARETKIIFMVHRSFIFRGFGFPRRHEQGEEGVGEEVLVNLGRERRGRGSMRIFSSTWAETAMYNDRDERR